MANLIVFLAFLLKNLCPISHDQNISLTFYGSIKWLHCSLCDLSLHISTGKLTTLIHNCHNYDELAL